MTNSAMDKTNARYTLSSTTSVRAETGTPFDCTVVSAKGKRAGDHSQTVATVDRSAFSFDRELTRKTPDQFLKKGTGTACLAPGESLRIMNERIESEGAGTKRKKGPGLAGAFKSRENPPDTQFRRFYERGDLPFQVETNATKPKIQWNVEIAKLDFHHYLPLFFDGLREEEHPYSFLAEQGVMDMLSECPSKVLAVIPQLIIPIKVALNVRKVPIMCRVIRVLKLLVTCDVEEGENLIGQALVPYYRQILPVFNLFKSKNVNIGDKIDYHQQHEDNLGDLISECLELFEMHGGPDAFINIKYLIPTYESACLR